MALIVETGQGLAQADSYFAVADADPYFSERAMPAWALAGIAAKEAAARQAADYLGFAYSWRGMVRRTDQRLAWPRVHVPGPYPGVDLASDQVPRQVREAAMLLAHLALSSNLLQERPADRIIESERRELEGVGATEISYSVSPAKAADLPRYANVDAILADLILGTRASGGLQSRAAARR